MTGSEKQPAPCKVCYQFYGHPSTDDLCSKCYREKTIQAIKADTAKYYVEKKEQSSSKEDATTEDKSLETQHSNKKIQEIHRCTTCSKKVGLLGFKCQCGSTYCRNHRMPEHHECTFDFGKVGKERLRKENVVVIAEKVIKF